MDKLITFYVNKINKILISENRNIINSTIILTCNNQYSNMKTTIAKTFFQQNNIQYKMYNCISDTNICENIYQTLSFLNRDNFYTKKQQKYGLIIDNIDHISLIKLKTILYDTITKNIQKSFYPQIVICKNIKLIKEILKIKNKKKGLHIINIELDDDDIKNLVYEYYLQEQKNFPSFLNKQIIFSLCKSCQFELKIIIRTLKYISTVYKYENYNMDFEKFKNILNILHIDFLWTDLSFSLLNIFSYISPDKKYFFMFNKDYEKHKVLLPLLIYQNIISILNYDNFLQEYCDIINIIHYFSYLQNKLTLDFHNDISNKILSFLICYLVNDTCKKYYENHKTTTNFLIDIEHSIELNKNSLKNINKKNIAYIIENTNIYSKNQITKINSIIIYGVLHNNKDYLLEIFNFLDTFFTNTKNTEEIHKKKKKILTLLIKINKCVKLNTETVDLYLSYVNEFINNQTNQLEYS